MESYPPTMPPSPARFEDEADNSSVSDYDSEWTQISQSEDESDARQYTFTTDRSLSYDSLDCDAWEGVADDSQNSTDATNEQSHLTDSIISAVDANEGLPHINETVVDEDDNRINAALDSSLTGTLEVRTRSLTASFEGSVTASQSKLRLSFPDPLLRSREDLSRSYEDVDHSRASVTSSADEQCNVIATNGSFTSSVDTGSSPTPEVLETSVQGQLPLSSSEISFILSIALYGSRSASRWTIAEKVMKLAFPNSGEPMSFEDKGTTRIYRLDTVYALDEASKAPSTGRNVRVVDHTLDIQTTLQDHVEEPSLAIVLLPSRIQSVLPSHNLYLPLVSQPSLDLPSSITSSAFSEKVVSDSAQYSWEHLNIPQDKILVLRPEQPNVVLDEMQLDHLDKNIVAKAFTGLFPRRRQRFQEGSATIFRIGRRYASGFLLLTAVAAGLFAAFNASASEPGHSEHAGSPAGGMPLPAVNNSNPGIFPSLPTAAALIHSTFKEYARSVFLPASPVTSGTISCRTPVLTTAHVIHRPTLCESYEAMTTPDCECGDRLPSWSNRLKLSKDLAIRPASTVHVFTDPLSKGKTVVGLPSSIARNPQQTDESERSLSTCVYDSVLSNANAKAVAQAVSKDLKVLYDAIDELLQALRRQVEGFMNEWATAKKQIGELIEYRNGRARENAMKLRRKGGQFLSSAGATLQKNAREMMGHARRRAQSVRKELLKSDQRVADDRRKLERLMAKRVTSLRKRMGRLERKNHARHDRKEVPPRGKEGVFGAVF